MTEQTERTVRRACPRPDRGAVPRRFSCLSHIINAARRLQETKNREQIFKYTLISIRSTPVLSAQFFGYAVKLAKKSLLPFYNPYKMEYQLCYFMNVIFLINWFDETHQFSVVVIYNSTFLIKNHSSPVFHGIRFPLRQFTLYMRIACFCKIQPCGAHFVG
jgi:hypothetical protein